MGDSLFPVYNNFFIGNYQVAINEGYELQGLSVTDATERDCYVYRSHIALGNHQLVIDEITDESPTALRAVKLLATYKSRPHEREQCVATCQEWLSDEALAANANVQLISALVFAAEDNLVEAIVFSVPVVRTQLGLCLRSIAQTDFEGNWPGLVPAICANLQQQQNEDHRNSLAERLRDDFQA